MKRLYPTTFFLCLFLLGARAYDRLWNAEIWAEDGTRCLQVVSESGLRTLFAFSDGYFYVLQKLIAFIALKLLPYEWIPQGISLSVWVITSLVFATFSLRSYSWVISSDRMRITASGLLCFVPGLHEVFGNLANLPSIFFLYLCLIGLRDPEERLGTLNAITAVSSVFSCGAFIVLFPLFLYRCFRTKDKVGSVLILASMALASIGIFNSGVTNGNPDFLVLREIPTVLFPYIIRGLLFQPWFGDLLTSALNNPHIKFWQGLLAVVLLLLTGIGVWRNREKHSTALFPLFFACVCLWPLLVWMTRPLSFPRFIGIPEMFWKDRYSFILGFVSVLFWLRLLSKGRRSRALFVTFVLGQMMLNIYRFPIPRNSATEIWNTKLLEIRSLTDARKCGRVKIEGIPREYDWVLTVDSCQ